MFLQVYGRLHHQLCASSRCFVSFATILCYLIIFFSNNMACNTVYFSNSRKISLLSLMLEI